MRNTIVNSLGILIWVMGGLILVGGVISGVMTMSQPGGGGIGLGIVVGSILYSIIFCGMFFMFMDIRDATRRTADAVENLANR